MRSDWYQYSLIVAGVVATIFFGVFWYRELYPEYKIYQNDYVELEKFHSTYSKEPPAHFQEGIKQIIFERKDKGPPNIERCISCHVALDIPYFSPTKLKRDINGNLVLDTEGRPIQVPNEDYIWKRLDEKIAELSDPEVIKQLKEEGNSGKASANLAKAEEYRSLKTAQVGDYIYDVTKVLQMHPLMGRETRPFEYHPVTEFGCTSCHSGNGQGLTTEKAHGPVFDGQYETEFVGPVPKFTETDPLNDPLFSREFNYHPGPSIIFQTTPILVGSLVQAKCMNCHRESSDVLQGALSSAGNVLERRQKMSNSIKASFDNEKAALASLVDLKASLEGVGFEKTLAHVNESSNNYLLPDEERKQYTAQAEYMENLLAQAGNDDKKASGQFLGSIKKQMQGILGSKYMSEQFDTFLANAKKKDKKASIPDIVDKFIEQYHTSPKATGSLFTKENQLNLDQSVLRHVKETESSFEKTVSDQNVISAISSDIDMLTKNYHRGEELYISQACYACHRIAGFARGGVGPELTREGLSYPWFVKESIVWPQADLPTSTMPNYHLDHIELQDLMTYLLAQVGETNAVSSTAYQTNIQNWEAGKKMPWEKPITPAQMRDLHYSMTVFATQGCSACHRLKGFESNVGYAVELKGKPDFDTLYNEKQWFKGLFPEMIVGSEIVDVLEQNSNEIDKRIVNNVRKGSILEEIDNIVPGQIESLYTDFKFASRAKNYEYQKKADAETDPKKKAEILGKLKKWKERIHRVLMVFIQEYGLGRLIGPRPNWSGVYRSDEWLMEHFHNPSAHVAHSIMPVMPFDDTKFFALTYMLDQLGKRNRDEVKEIWNQKGFDPEMAFQIHCAQCHGVYKQGNGPVSLWIYPIPKNLNNAEFLRNYTRERVIQSITHGVNGTPMPPWGEVAAGKPYLDNIPVLSQSEIVHLVDWLFSSLPGGEVIRSSKDVPKWHYSPEDVIKELKDEGNQLKAGTPAESGEQSMSKQNGASGVLSMLPTGEGLLASLTPMPIRTSPKSEKGDEAEINAIFDRKPNPVPGPDKWLYYIKKKYYTESNIDAGKQFFALNCAVCHGADADGTGIRAAQMIDAKPRMLINLDWIDSHDDIYMLRSIKFGVPGTAMTPWGDLTSSLQRLQLVIFIRSLTEENLLRNELSSQLYQAYEHSYLQVEMARVHEYTFLQTAQKNYNEWLSKRIQLDETFNPSSYESEKPLEIYQNELKALAELKKRQAIDKLLLDLTSQINKEKDIYQLLGSAIVGQPLEDRDFQNFTKLIAINNERYAFKNNVLTANFNPQKEKDIASLAKGIIDDIDQKIDSLQKQKIVVQGKIVSAERDNEIKEIDSQITNLTKLRNSLISGFEEAVRVRQKQQQYFNEYKQKLNDIEAAKKTGKPETQGPNEQGQKGQKEVVAKLSIK